MINKTHIVRSSFQRALTPAPDVPHTAEKDTPFDASSPTNSDRSCCKSSTHADSSSGVTRSAFVSTICVPLQFVAFPAWALRYGYR